MFAEYAVYDIFWPILPACEGKIRSWRTLEPPISRCGCPPEEFFCSADLGIPPFLKSYAANSKQEERLLQHARDFQARFSQTYGEERQLYLYPSNEIGVPKFLPTTLRPLKLSYPELNELKSCAKFIANYIAYEPLKDPAAFPTVVCSPSTTLFYQAGDAFDISVVLCSILIGAGYDAYCVAGIAPRWITCRSLKRRDCPADDFRFLERARDASDGSDVTEERKMLQRYIDFLLPRPKATDEDEPATPLVPQPARRGSLSGGRRRSSVDMIEKTLGPEFSLVKKPPLESEYVKEEGKAKARLEAQAAYEAERSDSDDAETEDEEDMDFIAALSANMKDLGSSSSHNDNVGEPSEFIGRRAHCWVLVRKGSRDVTRDVFVEPTTGIIFSTEVEPSSTYKGPALEPCPYLAVDTVWNNRNVWVNIQKSSVDDEPSEGRRPLRAKMNLTGVSMDVRNTRCYEPVLVDSKQPDGEVKADEGAEVEEENNVGVDEEPTPPPVPLAYLVGVYDLPRPLTVEDVPASWAAPPLIPKDRYGVRYCDRGVRMEKYRKAILELFAPYSQPDGVVESLCHLSLTFLLVFKKSDIRQVKVRPDAQALTGLSIRSRRAGRVTRFKDLRLRLPVMITETYKQRKDMLKNRVKYLADTAIREDFERGRSGALKSLIDIDEKWRCMEYFHETRPDGLERTVDRIGEKIKEYFIDRDDLLEYHSVKIDRSLKGTKMSRSLPSLPIESLGDIPMVKMAQKYRKPDEEVNKQMCLITELCSKIVFNLLTKSIRITYHRPEGRLSGQQLTFHKTSDGTSLTLDKLSRMGAGEEIELPTPRQLHQLMQLEKSCKHNFVETMNRITTELALRRKEESNVKSIRLVAQQEAAPVAQNAMGISGGPIIPDFASLPVGAEENLGNKRNLALVRDVYDYARDSSMKVTTRLDDVDDPSGGEQDKNSTKKVDILAPYLSEFPGKQLDALQAEFVAKKCKNDFRKRLLDRAAIIQKRLEDEQEALKKRRAQVQRRGGPEAQQGRAEADFEKYQTLAMFRIQILEQRLARHEVQAIKKFTELEETLLADPRLQAMWEKDPGDDEEYDEDYDIDDDEVSVGHGA
ncbi:hypothetical protein FOL47_011281 [Perkinsus chesapeaki]|uniref:Coiled-coil domain-containing protein lobo n=1 Tax=Perkinsus chesapeaki TaxID=330153 RepID=A0A7J6MMQ1_PERCH|nr:hypothetical protein FOL47_011281 [Perkinsus chesapeaki]